MRRFMNTKKMIVIAGLAFSIGCAVVNMMAVKRRQIALTEMPQQAGPERRARELPYKMAPSPTHLNSPGKESVHPEANEEVTAAQQVQRARAGTDVTPRQMPTAPQPGSPKAPTQDPLAREALSLVGEDPEATEYWATAINDPSLPDEERKDLIEDLNEDGLSDAKHPAPEDLPVILNRIELIEELAPYAMDQVNADAFAEAYKDLLDMLNGQPVQ